MRLLVITLLFLGISSCRLDLDGHLNVTTPITITHDVKEQWGDAEQWRSETTLLPVQNTSTSLSLAGCCQLSLVLHHSKWNKQTFNFELPKNTQWPESNGEFYVKGTEMNQVFDLQGNLSTHQQQGELIKRQETCTYTVTEQSCDSRGCSSHQVTRYGYQRVEYYPVTIQQNLNVSFLNSQSLAPLGQFTGEKTTLRKDYVYKSICR